MGHRVAAALSLGTEVATGRVPDGSVCPAFNRSPAMGDTRTYEKVLALRAVMTADGMPADLLVFPWDVLGRRATRIVNEVRGVKPIAREVPAVDAAGFGRVESGLAKYRTG